MLEDGALRSKSLLGYALARWLTITLQTNILRRLSCVMTGVLSNSVRRLTKVSVVDCWCSIWSQMLEILWTCACLSDDSGGLCFGRLITSWIESWSCWFVSLAFLNSGYFGGFSWCSSMLWSDAICELDILLGLCFGGCSLLACYAWIDRIDVDLVLGTADADYALEWMLICGFNLDLCFWITISPNLMF